MKRKSDGGEDHLSDLPNSIMSNILSAMPTKDAVRTSILSRKWYCRWTSIHSIQVACSSDSENEVRRCFAFVERVLLLKFRSPFKTLSLSFKKIYEYDRCRLSTWIAAVLLRNVQCIEITCLECEPFVLPSILYHSSSLNELKILMPWNFVGFSNRTFPYLKALHLGGRIGISNDTNKMEELCLVFPVLKVLQLSNCVWLNVYSVKIFAPELTIFRTENRSGAHNDCRVSIIGNKLEKFESIGCIDHFVLNSPSTYYAKLYDYGNGHVGFRTLLVLDGLPGLKHLRVRGELIECMTRCIITSKRRYPLFFRGLETLHIYYVAYKTLMPLLKTLPSLGALTVEVEDNCPAFCSEYDTKFVESCLSSKVLPLKDVNLKGFHACKTLICVATDLLKNMGNLEKMSITLGRSPRMQKNQIETMLSKCLRKSTSVTIMVNEMII